MTAKFDALAVARALARAGVEEPHAKAIAGIVRDSRADLATRDDVRAIKVDIHAVMDRLGAGLRAEIAGRESGMQAMIYRALRIQAGAIFRTIIVATGVVAAIVV